MEYSVSELAQAAGLSIDTIRYYQSMGLLAAPERRGRRAVYSAAHLERLRLIRSLAGRGLSLKLVGVLLDRGSSESGDRELLAAIEEQADEPSYSGRELAECAGIPHSLLVSVEKSGLVEGQEDEAGRRLYSEADLHAAHGALKLLAYGFPLTKLLALAVRHDRAVRKSVDEAIDLFDDYVRKGSGGQDHEDPETVADAFKEILPAITGLIAHHFQRVLINRALKRLKQSGEKGTLEAALKVASKNRVGLRWQ